MRKYKLERAGGRLYAGVALHYMMIQASFTTCINISWAQTLQQKIQVGE